MSQVLFLADTQIEVQTVDLADQRAVLDQIVQVALDRKVDAVVHGGDVFEGPVVTPEHLRTFIDATAPLTAAGIPLLLLLGNGRHDMAVRGVHALDVLREVDGIQVADRPTVAVLAGKVAVCALPWVHPGRLIASMNGSLTHDEANETTAQTLVKIGAHLRGQAQNIAPGMPAVLVAHWAISGSALPTGLPVDEMHEAILPWAELDDLGYTAVVGAHVHEPQQISQPAIDKTLGIVVGSPQQLSHGEKGDHGCWIVEFGGGYTSQTTGGIYARTAEAEFVPIESRQFVTVSDRADLRDIPPGAIVRVRYEATEDDARRIDHDNIRRELLAAGASRITIEPTIIRKERARAQQISETLSPVDALAEYCDANEIPPDRALTMLARLKEWGDT